MAQNDRVQRVLLQWEADQASLKRTLQGNAQISGSIQTVEKQQQQLQNTSKLLQVEFDKVGRGRQFDALALNFAKARAEGKDTTAEVERLTRALQALGATKAEIAGVVAEATRLGDEMERSSANSGGLGNGGRLGRIGSELRMLPSVQTGLGFGTDAVANVIRVAGAANSVLESTGVSLEKVAVAGGIAGVALVGTVLVFSAFTAEIDRQKNAIKTLIDANRQRYEQERTLTTEQAQAQLRALEITRDAANQAAADAFRAREQARLNYGGTAAGSILAELFQGTESALADADKKARDAQLAVDNLNISLDNNAFAAQDAAAAERALAEARTQAILRNAEDARQLPSRLAQYSQFTEKQAQSELDRLRNENQGLFAARREIQNSGDTSQAASDQIAAYTAQIRENQFYIGRLIAEYVPAAAQRDREIQALKDMVKASDELNKARTKVQDAEAALATEAARNADAIGKINAELLDKQYEINRKAQLAIDEAQLDAEQGRTKAQQDAAEKRVKAEQKAQEDLLKAQRQFNRDYGSAVANRDALAAFEAKQKYDDEKSDIKSALKAQKKEIEDGYKEQLRTVDARLKDQLRLIEQRKSEELRLASKAATAALNIEVAKHNAEIAARQQALNIAVQQYRMFISQLNAAVGSYNGGQIYLPKVVDLPPVQNQQQAYQQFLAYQRSQIPGFAGGLERVPYDNFLARLHQDERVLNKQEARMYAQQQRSGGLTFAPTIYGTNRRQIRREVDQRLNDTLKAAGVPA